MRRCGPPVPKRLHSSRLRKCHSVWIRTMNPFYLFTSHAFSFNFPHQMVWQHRSPLRSLSPPVETLVETPALWLCLQRPCFTPPPHFPQPPAFLHSASTSSFLTLHTGILRVNPSLSAKQCLFVVFAALNRPTATRSRPGPVSSCLRAPLHQAGLPQTSPVRRVTGTGTANATAKTRRCYFTPLSMIGSNRI